MEDVVPEVEDDPDVELFEEPDEDDDEEDDAVVDGEDDPEDDEPVSDFAAFLYESER